MRAGERRAVGFPPGTSVQSSHGARSARATLVNARSWPVGGLMRGSCRCGPPPRGSARFRALDRREFAHAALRITGERAAQHSRALDGMRRPTSSAQSQDALQETALEAPQRKEIGREELYQLVCGEGEDSR